MSDEEAPRRANRAGDARRAREVDIEQRVLLALRAALLEGRLVDEDGRPVATGTVGHLFVKPQIVESARGCLASHKTPRSVEFLTELPKTGTGKIRRFRLRST